MPDAGDTVTASLVVEPYDITTAVVLTVAAPDGTVTTPVISTADGGQTWTGAVTYTAAGVWHLTWTVTSTGAAVDHEAVSVAPTPGAGDTDRVYATTTQLANYLRAAPPLDADRLLANASALLENQVLRYCWYEVDEAGMPTDPIVAAAFAAAVCAQVEWWDETGDELGVADKWGSVKLGSASMSTASSSSGAAGSGGGRTVASTAMERLRSPDLTSDRFIPGLVYT